MPGTRTGSRQRGVAIPAQAAVVVDELRNGVRLAFFPGDAGTMVSGNFFKDMTGDYKRASHFLLWNRGGPARRGAPGRYLRGTARGERRLSRVSFGPSSAEALEKYLDGFLDYHFNDPTAFRTIILNLALADRPETIPGYRRIPEMLAHTGAAFMAAAGLDTKSDGAARYFYSFNNLLITFLGASASQGMLLSMKKNDSRYRQWVKDTMTYLFLPPLQELMGRQ